jgi:cytochrome c5
MAFRSHVLMLALLAALAATGCPPSTPKKDWSKEPPQRTKPVKIGPSGDELYKSSCSACHGPDARGLPNIGKDLVTGEFCRTQTDDQLLAFIKRGREAGDPANTTKVAMPPKGGNPALSESDIRSIIAHVRSLQQAAKP